VTAQVETILAGTFVLVQVLRRLLQLATQKAKSRMQITIRPVGHCTTPRLQFEQRAMQLLIALVIGKDLVGKLTGQC